ncbi:unnamed protein product [Musa acuminata subsp. burmannicoides]
MRRGEEEPKYETRKEKKMNETATRRRWDRSKDGGFVYKRRRRRSRIGRQPADPEAELRRCLHDLRDRYRRELAQWDRLSPDLLHPIAAAAAGGGYPAGSRRRRGKKPGLGRALTKTGFTCYRWKRKRRPSES